MKRLSLCTLSNSLLTIGKTFVPPHLYYAGIVYDKPDNINFKSKLERLQHDPCLELRVLFNELMD